VKKLSEIWKKLWVPVCIIMIIVLGTFGIGKLIGIPPKAIEQMLARHEARKQQEVAQAAKKLALEKAPFIFAEEPTKVLTLTHDYLSVLFGTFEVVEFMGETGYVYRSESLIGNPIQTTFHHVLMLAKDKEEELMVCYKTKGQIDDNRRIVTEIRNARGYTLWPVPVTVAE
jgi:hypothetical protein